MQPIINPIGPRETSYKTSRSLRSFPFFRKERKSMELSFGSHKLPKTREKKRKRTERSLKERKRMERTERKRTRYPTLNFFFTHALSKQ